MTNHIQFEAENPEMTIVESMVLTEYGVVLGTLGWMGGGGGGTRGAPGGGHGPR